MSEENFIARWSRRKRKAADDDGVTSPPERGAPFTPPRRAEGRADPPLPGEGGTESGAATSTTSEHEGATASGATPATSPPFDPASLPPIESITAQSDIRAFLAPGVPPELARAALRRVWTADPQIRDFVGLAEYAWDFNTPGAVPGFGPLEMTDELRRAVDMIVRGAPPAAGEEPIASAEPGTGDPLPVEMPVESARLDAPSSTRLAAGRESSQVEPANEPSEAHNSQTPERPATENVAVQNSLAKTDTVQTIVKRAHGRALPK